MKPLVSICCITYNQEDYIADALESFLMQETSFEYEIIIYDDASTDKTRDIIAKYYKQYPDIIKPIFQKENQYSKGNKPFIDFVFPNAVGKYIATCEGDDYWTDNKKLEKQYNILENNPKYSACFHPVAIVDLNGKPTGRYLGTGSKESHDLSISNAAKGGVMHISSWFVKSELLKNIIPSWISNAIYSDWTFALYFAIEGNTWYLNEVMSAYRTGVIDSLMTLSKSNYTIQKDIDYNENVVNTIHVIDEYYEYKFHTDLDSIVLFHEVIISLLKGKITKNEIFLYSDYIKKDGVIAFIKTLLIKKFPDLTNILLRIPKNSRGIKNE